MRGVRPCPPFCARARLRAVLTFLRGWEIRDDLQHPRTTKSKPPCPCKWIGAPRRPSVSWSPVASRCCGGTESPGRKAGVCTPRAFPKRCAGSAPAHPRGPWRRVQSPLPGLSRRWTRSCWTQSCCPRHAPGRSFRTSAVAAPAPLLRDGERSVLRRRGPHVTPQRSAFPCRADHAFCGSARNTSPKRRKSR